MPGKNRRDPFAGVPPPSARRSRGLVLREIAGRMRNIAVEKHLPRADADAETRETVQALIGSVDPILQRPFGTPDVDHRLADIAAALESAAGALRRIDDDAAARLRGTYDRWRDRLIDRYGPRTQGSSRLPSASVASSS